jgi:type VI protein secretion system component Hcp
MKKIFSLFLISGVLFFSGAYGQQTDIFIKVSVANDGGPVVGNFNGGSNKEGHEDEIEAWSYSYGLAGCSNAPLGSERSACKISGSSFTFSMQFNNSLLSFKNALLLGKHLNVDVEWAKHSGDQLTYYKMLMENVQIASVQESGSSEPPAVFVELQPQRVAWAIPVQNPNGSFGPPLKYGWDFATNKAWNYNF